MSRKGVFKELSIIFILPLILILGGCAIQLQDRLVKDESELARIKDLRKDYCGEGERLFAKAEATLSAARHEIIDEGYEKAESSGLLTEAEDLMAKAEKTYGECTPPPPPNRPPKAAFDSVKSAYVGDEVVFDGTLSTDPDRDPIQYSWDLGDGSTSTDAKPSHVYKETGTYTVALEVTDCLSGTVEVKDKTSKTIDIKKKLPDKIRLVIEGVHFPFDSSSLTASAKEILDDATETIKARREYSLMVEGHTDAIGSEEYNMKLSERRAETVKKYLQDKGAEESRMTAKGYGELQPIASNATNEGRAKNRRVELLLVLE